jgi:hypothetical protein
MATKLMLDLQLNLPTATSGAMSTPMTCAAATKPTAYINQLVALRDEEGHAEEVKPHEPQQ